MAGLRGEGRSRLDVLVGTLIVMMAMIGLVVMAGSFGHTRTINLDLRAPHLASPNPPAWM
ncbi:MAG TPA: hypothetical protein VGG29_07265 [Caulobacteraceae bacterium]|jgi:hypothetical protein